MLWLIWISVFLAVTLLVYSLVILWTRRQRVKSRVDLNPMASAMSAFRLEERQLHPIREWALDLLAFSGQWEALDLERSSAIRQQLILAGYRHPGAVTIFFGIRIVLGLLIPIPFLLVALIRGNLTTSAILSAFALSCIGFFVPNYILRIKARQRQNLLDKALPDIIDLMIVCIEAGLALYAAVNRVADEIRDVYPDFFAELQLTAAELRAPASLGTRLLTTWATAPGCRASSRRERAAGWRLDFHVRDTGMPSPRV